MHVCAQALEERLRLVRAQRNKLLSAFENLQGSGQYSWRLQLLLLLLARIGYQSSYQLVLLSQ